MMSEEAHFPANMLLIFNLYSVLSTASLSSSILAYEVEHGRSYHAVR